MDDARQAFDFLSPPVHDGDLGSLGAYRVLRLLGQGGMGIVFEAIDTQLQRPVALKVLNRDVSRSAEFRERFVREARATAAIKSDNIVTVYQVGEQNGVLFLAIELLEGDPLDRWLESHRRPAVADFLRMGAEIARGLAAAHERGHLHRDIKP